jgi:hypothetical protein
VTSTLAALSLAVAITAAPLVEAASPVVPSAEAPSAPAASEAVSGASPESAVGSEAPSSSQPDASGAQSGQPVVSGVRPLVLAYYYIWYTTTSWRRAKQDLPRLGTYDSRDRDVVAQQIQWAKAAGIDGLIVSWKHETRLDAALRVVVDEATKANMKLVLLYQGLDFDRLPLDDATVAGDLTWFLDNYSPAAPFKVFGDRPVIVWSGTWGYKDNQISSVRTAIGAPGRALLLGSERSADAYAGRAALFDGDAYYWSSPDPLSTPGYQRRLNALAAAVRADGGRWIAPAAPGFDARQIGGTSVVPRRDGKTLRAAWTGALNTSPDVLGLISWNEFSENSYVEPSKSLGDTYLKLVGDLTAALPAVGSPPGASAVPGSSAAAATGAPTVPAPTTSTTGSPVSNAWGVIAGALLVGLLFAVGLRLRGRATA